MTHRIPWRLALGLAAVPFVRLARAADTIRLELPTKAYWPIILTTTAVRQGFFAKEGIGAEASGAGVQRRSTWHRPSGWRG